MVIACDKALHKRLAAGAMAAGGAVQTFISGDEARGRGAPDVPVATLRPREPGIPDVMPAAIASVAARLPEGAALVPVIPAPDLEWTVLLLADPRGPCVLVGDELTASQVTA